MMTLRPLPKPLVTTLAEDDGFEAFVMGKCRADNPFHIGSDSFKAWLRGWNCAATYHGQ